MFHEILPFKYVLAFELNSCCTCTLSTDIGCRFIHLCVSSKKYVNVNIQNLTNKINLYNMALNEHIIGAML